MRYILACLNVTTLFQPWLQKMQQQPNHARRSSTMCDVDVPALRSPIYSESSEDNEAEDHDSDEDFEYLADANNQPLTITEKKVKKSLDRDKIPPTTYKKQNKKIIRDKYNIAYILFFILGTGSVCPSHAFLLSVDFFRQWYPSYVRLLSNVVINLSRLNIYNMFYRLGIMQGK